MKIGKFEFKPSAKLILAFNVLIGIVLLILLLAKITGMVHTSKILFPKYKASVSSDVSEQIVLERESIEKTIKTLQSRLDVLTPAGAYIVINTTKNHFTVYRKKEVVYEGFCSTGSSTLLESDDRQWLFHTPRGVFSVKGKITDPLWKKPDWAFVEEGLPVPSANHPTRFEYGVLGDYALNIGDGYLIHGTLFQRFIGLPVTHGCIRLNDQDLKFVYDNLNVGSKVFIY